MAARALMFQGTGSDVGKSLIVAGLCRAFANRGMTVRPFKPQNMSNNAAVTVENGEIGRAQALQARAARVPPSVHMNPVLLKPQSDSGSQVIVQGRIHAAADAKAYQSLKASLMPAVLESFAKLRAEADLVLVEGAGSASEVNLRGGDIANFGFARAANVPVVLIGDIHRGGVIASIVGTLAVIEPGDAALVRASLINKFFGDPALFETGLKFLAERTGRPCFGPVPHFAAAARLPAEDALALESYAGGNGAFHIAVPRLPRIANFDDLDPLRAETGVTLTLVQPGHTLPRDADLILLPGSKATRADLAALRANGWDIDILAHHRAGGRVMGICGGYQMLGRAIADPEGIEGVPGTNEGLGLLAVDTVLAPTKQLRTERAIHLASGEALAGYHMHMGITSGPDRARPFAQIGSETDGAVSADGRVSGTYLHGLFAADGFRRAVLGASASPDLNYEAGVEDALDGLAHHLESHIDIDQLLALAAPIET